MSGVLVIGKLGDICKKLNELELLLASEQGANKLLEVEVCAAKEAISLWQLSKGATHETVELKRQQLKITMVHLRDIEMTVKDVAYKNSDEGQAELDRLRLLVREYMSDLNCCRDIVSELNSFGPIGIIPENKDQGEIHDTLGV